MSVYDQKRNEVELPISYRTDHRPFPTIRDALKHTRLVGTGQGRGDQAPPSKATAMAGIHILPPHPHQHTRTRQSIPCWRSEG